MSTSFHRLNSPTIDLLAYSRDHCVVEISEMDVDLSSLICISFIRETSWRIHCDSRNRIIRVACDRSIVSLYEINFHIVSLIYEKNHGVKHVLLFQTQEEDVKNYDKQTF